MRNRRRTALLLALCLLGSSVGCGVQTQSETDDGYHALSPMESTPIVNYTVPEQTANVLASRMGYQSDSRKHAAVKGTSLPESFRVVNAESGETVYAGTIEKISYHAELGCYTGEVAFDGLEEPGTYYLECDKIGRSYTFSIEEDLYQRFFEEAYENMMAQCEAGELSLQGATALLTAYEWYGELFPDQDGDEVPDVLSSLAGWIERYEEAAEDAEQMLRAALLAKFSYHYQNYNRRYAVSCLQRASQLFGQTQNTLQKDADHFFALTELYRATGQYTYRNHILDYKSVFENSTAYLTETEYVYGAMTYMMTRQKVDSALCELLMKKLMSRGEEVADHYEELIHPVLARNNGTQEVLQCAGELMVANYVLESYQYYNIEQDFLHYLGGRNLQSVSLYENVEQEEYLILLAQLAARRTEGN